MVALDVTMPEIVSTRVVRQRIGDLLHRVSLRQEEFIIERKGKPLAALVPVERLQQMQRFARQQALELMETQRAEPCRRATQTNSLWRPSAPPCGHAAGLDLPPDRDRRPVPHPPGKAAHASS